MAQQAKEEGKTTVNNAKKKMKVMVAIDESLESFHALKWAVDNLFGITGVSTESGDDGGDGVLTVLHVQQPFQRFVLPALSGNTETVKKAQEDSTAELLSRALQVCKDKMVKAEPMILEGDPKDMICQIAEQMHTDLLVVGSRGLGKVKRAFLGSVSDYCTHHAACPIVIVKPPKEQPK